MNCTIKKPTNASQKHGKKTVRGGQSHQTPAKRPPPVPPALCGVGSEYRRCAKPALARTHHQHGRPSFFPKGHGTCPENTVLACFLPIEMCLNITAPDFIRIRDTFVMSFVKIVGQIVFNKPTDFECFVRVKRFIALIILWFT